MLALRGTMHPYDVMSDVFAGHVSTRGGGGMTAVCRSGSCIILRYRPPHVYLLTGFLQGWCGPQGYAAVRMPEGNMASSMLAGGGANPPFLVYLMSALLTF